MTRGPDPEPIVDFFVAMLGLAFLAVPFAVPTWLLTVAVVPEGTLLQQAFLFTLVSIVLIMTVAGAFLMWVVGGVYIVIWVLTQIWILLG